jgi:hypothetical protein
MLQAGKYQYALRVTFESFVESGVPPRRIHHPVGGGLFAGIQDPRA